MIKGMEQMGKGLYTNKEIVGTLINDVNSLVKEFMSGQYIQGCARITSMSQKLTNLYNTINDDLDHAKATIETLKNELRAAGHNIEELTPGEFMEKYAKDGAENGGS